MAKKKDNKILFIVLAIFTILLISSANANITGNFLNINWGKWIPKAPTAPTAPTGPVTSPIAPAPPSAPSAPTASSGPTGPSGPTTTPYTPSAPSPPSTGGTFPGIVQPPIPTPTAAACGTSCVNAICIPGLTCSNGVCASSTLCSENPQVISWKGNACLDYSDNDLDGKVDCQDSGCATTPYCANLGCGNFCWTIGNCQSGFVCQNNACFKLSCSESQTALNCADNLDNDFDGLKDCLDPNCFGQPTCAMEVWTGVGGTGVPKPTPQICKDMFDNDLDGLLDQGDPDCFEYYNEGNYVSCLDTLDNDLDGFTDGLDISCQFFISEPNGKGCADRKDNDGNGFTDCADPLCLGHALCAEGGFGGCWDGADNDNDGRADGWDIDCINSGASGSGFENSYVGGCIDGFDNDWDNVMDCTDPDCYSSNYCACTDTDGGANILQQGTVTINGVGTEGNSDYCVIKNGQATSTFLIETSCNVMPVTLYGKTYSVGTLGLYTGFPMPPGTIAIDCSKISGFTKCDNGRCV